MTTQEVAWYASLFFMSLIAIVFIVVALKAKKREAYDPIKKKWTKARRPYIIGLVTLMVVVSLYTLRELPYDQPVYGEGIDPVVVDVEAFQFGWEISQTEFKVGEPVEFLVTTRDVTHGFGIYDEDMTLLAQTQAMPEYTNPVYITFDEPGTYQILCMEYCGLAHHLMTAEITVTE
jgi:cytochrome c oxidase subunit 2